MRVLTVASSSLCLALVACGGVVKDPARGDAGTPAARKAACDRWFKAQRDCVNPPPSPDEAARQQARFEASCDAAYDQPGASQTADDVERCSAALELECDPPDGPPLACDLRGSLPEGAPCISGTECLSGGCKIDGQFSEPPGGLFVPPVIACGKCWPMSALGEACDRSTCPRGSVCTTLDTSSSAPTSSCLPVTEGEAGASCDGTKARCKPGFYCNREKQCAPLGGVGDACPYEGDVGCLKPLVCTGTPPTCQAPRAAGSACGDPAHGIGGAGVWGCATGLVCSLTGVCEPFTWVEPGQACDGVTKLCRVGSCPMNPQTGEPLAGSTCPPIIPDGHPCKNTDTCDTFSECVNPTGGSGTTTGVCQARSTVVCN